MEHHKITSAGPRSALGSRIPAMGQPGERGALRWDWPELDMACLGQRQPAESWLHQQNRGRDCPPAHGAPQSTAGDSVSLGPTQQTPGEMGELEGAPPGGTCSLRRC